MDFKSFYNDVINWMEQSNQKVRELSFDSSEYWNWVSWSAGELCNKYGNHELVMRQMMMLVDYQMELYERFKER